MAGTGDRPVDGGAPLLVPAELRRRREALGLSQASLARALGVTANTLARWERGQQRLANPRLVQLALERLELADRSEPAVLTGRRLDRSRAHNLPAAATSFVGRRRERQTLRQLVRSSRLVTVTGAAGIGKTRLALEVARDLVGRFADGVWLVELAALTDAALLLYTVAAALRLPEEPSRDPLETLVDGLAEQSLLLVLDNCEHLAPECATLAGALLRGCAEVRLLVTSRAVLGVMGEVTWRLPPLSLPPAGEPPGPEHLGRSEAAALFLERARAAEPGFAPTVANASSVAEICRRLDGLPLALELAAARLRGLGPDQLAARLDDRLRVLVDGPRSSPAHHQTLQTTIDWSYALLSDAERALFGRLSVFVGGWTLEAAEAVCAGGAIAQEEVLGLVGRLTDRSLVVPESGERDRLLETLRVYAGQTLAGTERTEAESRHAEYFAGLAERAGRRLVRADQAAWVVRLEQELGNVRAALGWCLDHPEPGIGLGVRIVAALTHYWELGAHLQEGRDWLRRLFEKAPAQLPERYVGLSSAGYLAWLAGDVTAARAAWHGGLRQAREDNAIVFLPRLLIGAGTVLAWADGDLDGGRALAEEGFELARDQGDLWGVSLALFWLAHTAREQGDHARARTLLEESTVPLRQLGGARHLGYTLTSLGMLAHDVGDLDAARRHYREALEIAHDAQDVFVILVILQAIAGVLAATGQARLAARLVGVVSAQRARLGGAMEPTPGLAERRSWTIDKLRRSLGEREFGTAQAAGRRLTPEQAVLEVLAPDASAGHPSGYRHLHVVLSRREWEVARLVAGGLSNRDIARQLVIAEGTAQRHVANILAKLGCTSRAQVVAWVLERTPSG